MDISKNSLTTRFLHRTVCTWILVSNIQGPNTRSCPEINNPLRILDWCKERLSVKHPQDGVVQNIHSVAGLDTFQACNAAYLYCSFCSYCQYVEILEWGPDLFTDLVIWNVVF